MKKIKALAVLCMFIVNISMAHDVKNKINKFYTSPSIEKLNLPFSEAVRVGNTVYLSGQIGMDAKKGKIVEGGIKPETKQTMENIKATLQVLDLSMKDIVKCTIMLADIAEWAAFNEVYVTYFSKPFPARSAFGTSGLAFNSRVEIECLATVGD